MTEIQIYDTTLRDGTQGEEIAFSLEDKLAIAQKLDEFGVDFIEGGWPMSNPKDEAFFALARKLSLKHARLVAFGSTRKAANKAQEDPNLLALVQAGTPVVTVFGKSWSLHVMEVLRVSLEEDLRMIGDSVRFLKSKGKMVIFDAEHFFDGYKENPKFALKTLGAAQEAGADVVVLCDTNGGSLPSEVTMIVIEAKAQMKVPFGIHTHNDSDLAVANALAAVEAGATHVQGTMNGLGERCGNVDLCSVIPNLVLKMKRSCAAAKNLRKLTDVSRFIYEMANLSLRTTQPFVGVSAFAHKAGVHVHAMQKNERTYEHICPEQVGNERRILISELSGSSNVLAKVEKYNLTHDKDLARKIVRQVQDLENEGYQFEAAEASFELLVKKAIGAHKTFFDLEGFSVHVDKREDGQPITWATVKIKVKNQIEMTASDGDGPVNALDGALRKALDKHYPSLNEMHLTDYKVRVVNPKAGTAAKVRVIIESADRDGIWGTVGVSENVIEASWRALVDSIEYKLLKEK